MVIVSKMRNGSGLDSGLNALSSEEICSVSGGVRLVTVRHGEGTAVVDWDRLEWDIMTGRIGVTFK